MMSRISGNYTNNTGERNVVNVLGAGEMSTMFVNAYATDSTPAPVLATVNKQQQQQQQRKKRKKKKDSHKLTLTNTQTTGMVMPPPTICTNCDKHHNNTIEGSLSSAAISTCSNCAATACVYCRLNDSMFDGNFYAQTEAHFHCDFPKNRTIGEHQKSIENFWPSNGRFGAGDYWVENNDRQHLIQLQQSDYSAYNRHIDQLQRFAIYENLCAFCGFAIGNGEHHVNCVSGKQINRAFHNNNNNNKNNNNNINNNEDDRDKSESHTENIYENICEKCHSIFDGEKCLNVSCACACSVTDDNDDINDKPCVERNAPNIEVIDILVKKPPIANRQFGRQFSAFLGSFKQRLTPKPQPNTNREFERKRQKIEIVHNVDEAFKTNHSFDLKEIVRLKNQCSDRVTRKRSEYGKLRNQSEETVNNSTNNLSKTELNPRTTSTNLRAPVHLYRTSTSDSNFLDNYHLSSSSSRPPHYQSPSTESIVSDTVLYSNSYAPPCYEDAIQDKYTSVIPFQLRARTHHRQTYDSTSASSFFTCDSSDVSTLHSYSHSHSSLLDPKHPRVASLFEFDESLRDWVTSLKQQIFDYGEDNRQFECDSIKFIPPKMFNLCEPTDVTLRTKPLNNHSNKNIPDDMTTRTANNETEQTNLRCRVETFKMNLLKQRTHSKRNAIYIDNSTGSDSTEDLTKITESISIEENANAMEDTEMTSQLMEMLTSTATMVVEAPVNIVQNINHTIAQETTTKYLQMLKAFYMTQIALSTSLNRITLVCGDRRTHFLVKILFDQPHNEFSALQYSNETVCPTRYMSFDKIFEIIYKMNITKQLSDGDKCPREHLKQKHQTTNEIQPKPIEVGRNIRYRNRNRKHHRKLLSLDDFLKQQQQQQQQQSTNLLLENPTAPIILDSMNKYSIDDFAKEFYQQSSSAAQSNKCNDAKCTMTDFHKPIAENSNACNKTINDFAWNETHYSSTHTSNAGEMTKQRKTIETNRKPYEMNTAKASATATAPFTDPVASPNIYQPIWMFETVGAASDTSYDLDSLNSFNEATSECCGDDIKTYDGSEWEIAEGEFLFSTNRIKTTIQLLNEHENEPKHISNTHTISHTLDGDVDVDVDVDVEVDADSKATAQLLKYFPSTVDSYETVCILYNEYEPKLNKFIYDYNANALTTFKKASNRDTNQIEIVTNAVDENTADCMRNSSQLLMKRSRSNIEMVTADGGQVFKPISENQLIEIKLDSINAWKSMLRTVDYIEDEEDVVLNEKNFSEAKKAMYNERNIHKELEASSTIGDTSICSEKPTGNDLKSTKRFVENQQESNRSAAPSNSSMNSTISTSTSTLSSVSSSSTNDSKTTKKESSLFNKLQYKRFDISKMGVKKDETVQGFVYRHLSEKNMNEWKTQTQTESSPPMEIKRLHQTTNPIVFGATLEDVEKDEHSIDIPKFVVECIRIIEIDENMQTNGIYRASGRKDSIDKVRKRMNDLKLRKATKYVTLKDEDVHTITGALKQFFRELKTDLIPDELVKSLPDDLENEKSLVHIRNQVSTIEYLPRETLKYLLQHLIRVDANSKYNLMNASNLSIVWGASLFTSSVNLMNAFETSDLMRKNTLVKVLIQKYDDIFIDIDRLI